MKKLFYSAAALIMALFVAVGCSFGGNVDEYNDVTYDAYDFWDDDSSNVNTAPPHPSTNPDNPKLTETEPPSPATPGTTTAAPESEPETITPVLPETSDKHAGYTTNDADSGSEINTTTPSTTTDNPKHTKTEPPTPATTTEPPAPVTSVTTAATPVSEPEPITQESAVPEALDEHGSYTAKDDVALYIHTYGHLPDNFITKKEAEELGWSGGSLEPYAPGKCIGGNRFGNYEGLLPEKEGRSYTECDIDTLGAQKRGAKRIVFSNDGLIYYTDDHYESFVLLYGDESA